MGKTNKILFMGTYPPRECGIATFTKDLTTAFGKRSSPDLAHKIIAMDDRHSKNIEYPKEVMFRINEDRIDEYVRVAKKINKDDSIKLVNIQHEFGIFGGKFLNYLSAFLETLNKPVVITLHSIPPSPPDNIKSIVQYLSLKASRIVVMVNKAVEILREDYGIPSKKIVVISHGIHEVPYEASMIQKTKLGYGDRILLSSFGLIGGGKGYEDIIKALPGVVKEFPDTLYLIIGATHPGILRKDGEKYRNHLKKIITRLNLKNHVKFVNRYLELEELLQYLRATDIFVSSGRGLHQITSGTLSYAMGCGRPAITIPFVHAKEIVTPERGILVELGNPKSFSSAIKKLLSDELLRERMGENAYEFTRHMLWDNVAGSYMKVFEEFLK